MKNKIIFLLFFILLVGCRYNNDPSHLIQGYQSSNEHYDEDALRDHTDYCEYIYTQDDISLFKSSKDYQIVTDQNIDRLKGFVENFSDVIQCKDGYQQWYRFDIKALNIGDYFYLEVVDPNEVYGEYHCYNLYYFDVSDCTLYYVSSYN